MNLRIVLVFLAGAVAATVGSFIAIRTQRGPDLPMIIVRPAAPPPPVFQPPTPAPPVPVVISPVAKRQEPKAAPAPAPIEEPAVVAEPQLAPPPPIEIASAEPTRIALTQPEPAPQPVAPVEMKPAPNTVLIPYGTILAIRMSEPLSTKFTKEGDTFAATLDQDLVIDGFIIADHGSRVEGHVTGSDPGGRVKGTAWIGLELTKINTSDGQTVAIHTHEFIRSAPASKAEDFGKIGAGAAIGAAAGAAVGQGKGAAIGAAAGAAAGAATVAMTRGKPAEVGVESRLSFRLNQPVQIVEKIDKQ